MSSEAEDRAAAEAAGLSVEQQAALTAYHSEENFLLLHRPQLESMQLPKSLWSPLYHKLYLEQFDALDTYAVVQFEEEGDEGYHLVVEKEEGVNAQEDVWIFGHAWDVNEADAVQQLMRTPGLVDRLWTLMDLDRRLRREEEEREVQKQVEAEAQRRREDRKEPEDVEAERKLKEAEEEKARERERREGEEEWVSEESIACVMSQTEANREAAAQALKNCRGDLIDAINSLSSGTDTAPASTSASTSTSTYTPTPTPAPTSAPVDASSLSDEEHRAQQVWNALFRYRYVRSFFTTTPREDGRPLTAADVTSHLVVEDEVGSAIVAGQDPNARVSTLMCITLNTSFSVMWLTRGLEQGDEVVRSIRPAVKKTREWTPPPRS